MDIFRPLVFIPIAIYCIYSFKRSRQNIYLIFGILSWYGAIYAGKHNIYQSLQEPSKSIIYMITVFLVVAMFVPYFKTSIKEYKEYKR